MPRREIPVKTAAVFNFEDLPTAAKDKMAADLNGMAIDDLHPAQQALAQVRDVTAIIKDGKTTIISPTGDFVAALRAVNTERGV